MKQISPLSLFPLFLLLPLFFLISCDNNNLEDSFSSLESTPKSSEFFLSYRDRHPSREETLNQALDFYGESEICEDSRDCSNICGDLFQYSFDQQDCKNLPPPLVNRFKFIYKIFENKEFYSLQELSPFDLKVFLSFSLEPSAKLFSKLGSSSSKDFLKRLASDWDMAQIFVQEDLDFILLEILLNEIASEPISSLGETMASEKTFQEIALIKQNDFAVSLIHDFFNYLCDNKEECILDHYCSVSKEYDQRALLELSKFESLKKILTKQRGPDSTLQSGCPIL